MPITTEEAARIARAYSMTLTDAATLITMADTVEEAQHIAIQFAGTAAERSDEAHTLARKQRDAEAAAENQEYAKYREANPKPPKSARKPVEPDLRDGMSDNDRVRAINKAHEANVRAEAEDRADAAQQSSRDYYAWKQTLNPHGQSPGRVPGGTHTLPGTHHDRRHDMILDAFDPGPLGDFPSFPRSPDGTPLWSDTAAADGIPVDGVTPMPRGLRRQSGKIVDLTPTGPDGTPINPPPRLP